MALRRFGFIVCGSGLDAAKHHAELRSESFLMRVVGITSLGDGPAVAKRMVADGVELIELCGGFGPAGTAAVIAAIEGRVPVGSVAYGPESIAGLHALFDGG